MKRGEAPKLIDDNGLRHDGRRPDELRPIKIEVGILSNADGSALVEMGGTKVMAAVYGPRELFLKYATLPNRASLRFRYHMAPFSTRERKSPAPTRREIELSKILREALEPVIFSETYPRTTIDVFVEVLQADGGTRVAGLIAASLALADAGIPMRDLVAGVAVGKVNGVLVLDIDELEDNYGEADLPIAMMPSLGEIVLFQLNGVLSPEELKQALALAKKGIDQIYRLEKEVLRRKYVELGGE